VLRSLGIVVHRDPPGLVISSAAPPKCLLYEARRRGVEKSRGWSHYHADSGSFYEGLSRKLLPWTNSA